VVQIGLQPVEPLEEVQAPLFAEIEVAVMGGDPHDGIASGERLPGAGLAQEGVEIAGLLVLQELVDSGDERRG
jgi:hypothetical protein